MGFQVFQCSPNDMTWPSLWVGDFRWKKTMMTWDLMIYRLEPSRRFCSVSIWVTWPATVLGVCSKNREFFLKLQKKWPNLFGKRLLNLWPYAEMPPNRENLWSHPKIFKNEEIRRELDCNSNPFDIMVLVNYPACQKDVAKRYHTPLPRMSELQFTCRFPKPKLQVLLEFHVKSVLYTKYMSRIINFDTYPTIYWVPLYQQYWMYQQITWTKSLIDLLTSFISFNWLL